ncbi:MAG: 5-formyltetrahydrofolate cyclo-ligase [Flavobacteriia bacterium]|nr:5-formyltetrahydrofolate cyclo-ligase [Flavobacteriia bacterium]
MNKKEIKELYQNKRKNLSPKELNSISEKICQLLFQQFNFENKILSVFLPIEKEKEINTYLILNKALSIESLVVVPKMNEEKTSLKHYLFEKESELEINTFGIPEIKKGKLIAADRLDFVIVPLFVSDKKGHRVGYGKGFYDRFLKKCRTNCIFIGISHFNSFETIDDLHQGDVKLHYLICPDKVYRFPVFDEK